VCPAPATATTVGMRPPHSEACDHLRLASSKDKGTACGGVVPLVLLGGSSHSHLGAISIVTPTVTPQVQAEQSQPSRYAHTLAPGANTSTNNSPSQARGLARDMSGSHCAPRSPNTVAPGMGSQPCSLTYQPGGISLQQRCTATGDICLWSPASSQS
jgi:hypothetical protein